MRSRTTQWFGVIAGWLSLTLVTFAVPAGAQQPPIPQLALWEAHMTSYGQTHCDFLAGSHTFDEKLNNVYYDAIRVFYQIADYTGNPAWNTCALRARAVYRDQYVLGASCWGGGFGCVPGYWNFTHGERMDYERTGDVRSKDAVLAQALNAAYSSDSGYNAPETSNTWLSREEAYGLMAHLNAEQLGAAPRASTAQMAEKSFNYMDQWFGSKTSRCPSVCDVPPAVGQYYIQPFMVSLTSEALIMWFNKTGDPRVLPAIRQAMDWLWANAWVPADQSFWYDNWVPNPSIPFPPQPGAPDLNLLLAPAYAWVYTQTGDTTYRDRADQIFAGGVVNAFLGNGKQFDQNYKWSFEYVRLRTGADAAAPTVSLTAPTDGATVSGSSVTVSANASDNVAVIGVQFKLDGANLGAEVTLAPYRVSWNSSSATAGGHTLTAVARDAAGNTSTSAGIRVTVVTDTTPPTVSVTAPTAGTTVSGTTTVTATAADNIGVAGVQFKLDGANLGAEVTSAPYTVAWVTRGGSNGSHSLTAVARDAAGNTTTSTAVSVTVTNDVTPPTVSITAPTAATSVSGTTTVTATAADNIGVAGVQFKLDGANLGAEVTSAPYSVSWTTGTASNGSHSLTAVARDAAGNRTTSTAVGVTVTNDSTPPTVAITAPTAGTTLTGTVSVLAAASDNVGVVGVQFKLDGVNLGTEVASPPYTLGWLTTAASTGTHSLTAVARDAAGNRTTSAAVTVTVGSGDTTAPTVSITGPAAGSTVGGIVSVTATAADNVGVAGVQFKLDGANLGAEVTSAPYSLSWTTTTVTDAAHSLTAVARDAAGNRTTSTAISVTVANGTSGSTSLTTGLVGYWAFDEGSGTTAGDASGSGNTGTLVNGPVWTAGRRGTAVAFDGTASYVRVPSAPELNSYPLTVAFWMKTASTSGVGGLVNKYADMSLNGYQVYMSAGRICAWYIKDPASYVDDGGACPLAVSGLNDNLWHQVALVVDATGGKMYVDGTLRSTLGWTGIPGAPTTAQELRIGHYPGLSSGGFFAGAIDDVRIWNPALNAADILTLFTGASDTTPPILTGLAVPSLSSSSATVSWTTNKAADTQVIFGPTTAYGSATALNPAFVISHAQTLLGLTPGMTYHYQVKSRDASGNLGISADRTFATPGAATTTSQGRRNKNKGNWFTNFFSNLL